MTLKAFVPVSTARGLAVRTGNFQYSDNRTGEKIT